MKATLIGAALCAACAGSALSAENGAPAQYDAMIAKHAQANGVPESLVRRIIVRESRYNPKARNGPYWGMMQLSVATARVAGFRGSPTALLDPETNIAYGVRYLAGAYKTAGGNHERAVGFYARGYYYAAKSKGLLASIGMGRDGRLTPPSFAAVPVIASAPASAPTMQVASNAPAQAAAEPAQPRTAIPLPPIRGAAPAPAAGPTLAAASPAAVVPLPPVRGASPQPQVAQAASGPRAIDPKTATPVMASMVPVPRPREEPAVTGSIQPRPTAARTASPVPQAAPAVATGPAIPLPPSRGAGAKPGPQAPALAYAEPARPIVAPIPQPRRAPVPPRR